MTIMKVMINITMVTMTVMISITVTIMTAIFSIAIIIKTVITAIMSGLWRQTHSVEACQLNLLRIQELFLGPMLTPGSY